MQKVKSIKYNFIMNFILTASNFIFPLITFPYVSRILLASGNGKIAFVTSVINYFTMIASLGIPTYGIRACARVRDDKDKLSKLVQELLVIHGVMTLITLIFLVISIFSIDKFYAEKELMIINGFGLFLNVLGVNWLYSALEQYQYITIRSIFFKLISIIMMFAFVHSQSDYILYGAISVFAAAGSNVLNFINLKKFVSFKKYDNYNFKQHLKPIMVFFAQSVAASIYLNLDTVMLGFIKGDTEVGLYSAAVKMKSILTALVTSLGAVLLPRLSYYISNGLGDEFNRLIKKAFEFVLLLSVPITIYFIVMSKESILLLSGDGFLGAVLAMQIIIPCTIFIGLSNITGIQMLTPLGKEKIVVYSVIAGAVIDLLLNVVFIPLYGSAGAAFGTLVAEIAVLAVQIYYIKHNYSYKLIEKTSIIKISIASIMSIIVLILVKNLLNCGVFITLLITAIIYFATFYLLCLIVKEPFVYEFVINTVDKIETLTS